MNLLYYLGVIEGFLATPPASPPQIMEAFEEIKKALYIHTPSPEPREKIVENEYGPYLDKVDQLPTQPKKKRVWADEQRAAAAKRMQAMHANKKLGYPARIPKPSLPRVDTSPGKLISGHEGYAGRRDPQASPLVDADWSDIKHRLKSPNETIAGIATDYRVSIEAMEGYIGVQRMREIRRGNADAPQKKSGA